MKDSLGFIRTQQTVIRELMGEEWLLLPNNRISSHPAYKKLLVCEKFISQGGVIRWPEDEALINNLCELILDSLDIVRSSGKEVDMFDYTSNVLGSFSGFGDAKSSSRIKSVINDPKTFSSLLTELSFAAWCESKDQNVTAYENDGYPDFKIESNDQSLPVFVECKKLLEKFTKNRISKIISKANKQIKKVNELGYGIVLIDATAIIDNPEAFSDEIPERILELKALIKNATGNDNSSVSAVVVWNDFDAKGSPESGYMQFGFRRRNMVIHHKKPIVSLPEDHLIAKYGATILLPFNFTLRKDSNKIRRNSRCGCGSGSRHKHCCGKIT